MPNYKKMLRVLLSIFPKRKAGHAQGDSKANERMLNYQKMYHILYYAVVGAERRNTEATKLLRNAIYACDEMYAEAWGKKNAAHSQSNEETAGE